MTAAVDQVPGARHAARLTVDYPERRNRLATLLRGIWVGTIGTPSHRGSPQLDSNSKSARSVE